MIKKEIVVYEMVDAKKELRILRLKPFGIEVRRGGWFSRKLLYNIEPKTARVQMKKSSYYGRKEFAPFCNGYDPHIVRIIDDEAGVHIFKVDRDFDAEVLDNYFKRAKGIAVFGG